MGPKAAAAGVAFVLFTLLATIPGWLHCCRAAGRADKVTQRHMGWDIVKMVLMFQVIKYHYIKEFLGSQPFRTDDTGLFSMYSYGMMGVSYTMPMFAFVSGLFSQHRGWLSLFRFSCLTLATVYLYSAFFNLACWLAAVPGKGQVPIPCFPFITWYLFALLTWRAIVAPMFHFASSSNLPSVLVLLLAFALSYMMPMVHHHSPTLSSPIQFPPEEGWLLATPFAVGLMWSSRQWEALFRERLVIGASCFIAFSWYFGLQLSGTFSDWAVVACRNPLHCQDLWFKGFAGFGFPNAVMQMFPQGLSWASLTLLLLVYVQQFAIGLSMLCLIHRATDLLQWLLPRFTEAAALAGSRTLYAYLLHVLLLNAVFVNAGLGGLMYNALHALPDVAHGALMYVLSSLILFICTSDLAVMLFSWMLEPYWIEMALSRGWQAIRHIVNDKSGSTGSFRDQHEN